MKIIVLHGDDYTRSSERLKAFQKVALKRGWEYQKISEQSSDITEILSGQGLFQNDKLVVIDEAKLVTSAVSDWIVKNEKEYPTTLVIYSSKTLPAAFLKSLPKSTMVEESKLPTKLWSMLDNFYPGNTKKFLSLMHEVCEKEPIEFVFSLLSKQLRDIYWLKVEESSFPQKGWRATKLKSVGRNFSVPMLNDLINSMAEIDIKSKTSDNNLIDLLDFIVITKLK